jgi:hypothetical protein
MISGAARPVCSMESQVENTFAHVPSCEFVLDSALFIVIPDAKIEGGELYCMALSE